ncbi:MAG: DUF2970 domain-containing protein [Gammaproteobacteria bacterium AqS3]|nr:DUF2970 domain-containing protein [Gammaproteobacteria bacterium AqS3]
MSRPDSEQNSEETKGLTVLQVVMSVLSAFFGVQSESNRRRDFEHGKPLHFIIAGLILAAAFVGAIALVVVLITP